MNIRLRGTPLLFGLALLAVGCSPTGQADLAETRPGQTSTTTPASTETPLPSPTQTATATASPTATATPVLPLGLPAINASNVANLRGVTTLGGGGPWFLQYTLDGSRLVVVSEVVEVFEIPGLRSTQRFQLPIGSGMQPGDLILSPGGRWLAQIEDGRARLWDLTRGSSRLLNEDVLFCLSVEFSPTDESLLMTADCHGWNPPEFSRVRLVRASDGHVLVDVNSKEGALSPDGQILAAASVTDRTITLWNARSGDLIGDIAGLGRTACPQTFPGLRLPQWLDPREGQAENLRSCMRFSPDSRFLAVSSQYGVLLWDVEEGRQASVFPGVARPSFSRDGRRLLLDRSEGVAIYDMADFHQSYYSATGDNPSLSPDGTYLATVGYVQLAPHESAPVGLVLTNLETRTRLSIPGYWRVEFVAGSDLVLVSNPAWIRSTRVACYSLEDGQELFVLEGQTDPISIPDGESFLTTSDGTIRQWSLTDGSLLRAYTGHMPSVTPDGGAFVSLWGSQILLHPLAEGIEPAETAIGTSPRAIGFLPSDGSVIEYGMTGVRLLDPLTMHEVATLPEDAIVSPTGHVYAIPVGETTELRRVDTRVRLHALSTGRPELLEFSTDGALLAVAQETDEVSVWNALSGEQELLVRRSGLILHMLIAPGDDYLVLVTRSRSGYAVETVHVLDIRSGVEVLSRTYECEETYVRSPGMPIAISPDGSLLAMGGDGCSIAVATLPYGTELLRLQGGHAEGGHMAFSAGGDLLATAFDPDEVSLWDIETGDQVRVLPAGATGLSLNDYPQVSFSLDGDYFAVANGVRAAFWGAPANTNEVRSIPIRLIRVQITTTSDWTSLLLPSGSTWVEPRTVSVSEEATFAGISNGRIHLDQSLDRASGGERVVLAMDVSLMNADPVAVTFEIQRGNIGSTQVDLFNMAGGTPVLIGTFTWGGIAGTDGLNPYRFSVDSTLLGATAP